ncbi:MAG: TolC family protein [Candidatus Rokubacteria bacterium]|nr:TolC family protein [Candidatus Rokubacteria bacterium]
MRSGIATAAFVWVTTSSALVQAQAPPPPPPPPVQDIAAGRQITVDEALAVALDGQPNIVARIADYDAARLRVDQALSPLLPQLTGTWTAARAQNVSTTEASLTTRERTITAWSTSTIARVSLSQVLFDFGKTFASVNAARALADVSLEELELQRQLIALAVKESYTNILFGQRVIRVNQQAQERAELNLRSARGFFDVGTRPKSDVTRAEVDVANARVDVIRARNFERSARVALNVAMGIAADTPTQVVDNLAYQPLALDRARLQTDALRHRPELRQAKLRADSAEALAKRAFLDFLPDITGTGFYGASRADMNEIWELGLNLNWPLFDGGNRIARYREARANFDAARARVKAQELDISREVDQAIIAVEEAQERIQAAQKAVESAQENFRLAQGRFDAGVGTILELTDAQLELTRAQNLEAQALADNRIALARLERFVGRR